MTIPTAKEPIDPDASQPGSHIYRYTGRIRATAT